MSPSLDISIVNWNSGRQLRECLESIAAASKLSFHLSRVVVVDNASSDRSLCGAEHLLPSLMIVRNTDNRGFAVACNQGAKGSKADYLLFLNPDTRLLENSLNQPLAFLEHPSNRRIGILGIQLVDEDGRVSRTCSRFPTPRAFFAKILGLDYSFPRLCPPLLMTAWNHGETRIVDQIMGAFFLVRRSLFEDMGGFDQRFFVYFEEVDFSLRARRAGWSSIYFADVKAYHRGGGTSENVKAMRLFYSLRSRIRYGYKHFGCGAATALMLATLVIEPITRLALAMAHRSRREAKDTLAGISRLWASAPNLLKDVN